MECRVVSHEELTTLEKVNDGKPSKDYGATARVYEYESAADPKLAPLPVLVHPAKLHESGDSGVIPFDLSKELKEKDVCTSPNLYAAFVRVKVGESVETRAVATSQAFYVIRGRGVSEFGGSKLEWSQGDLFVLPSISEGGLVRHVCSDASAFGAAALYWVHDGPLLRYLGVAPTEKRFEPTYFSKELLVERVQEISHENKEDKNRLGVLLGNAATEDTTLTLTHVLWSLLNSIQPHSTQRPHRHNSVALDLAVSAQPGVYTLMGKDLDATTGDIIDPIRCDWVPGSTFVTPPGWWHSHHNESDTIAWVLPMQDAGLYSFQRTLDIRFVDDELNNHRNNTMRGSAVHLDRDQYSLLKHNASSL